MQTRNPYLGQSFSHVECLEGGGGGGCWLVAEPATLKFFPLYIDNRNQTLHDVRYTFEEFIR